MLQEAALRKAAPELALRQAKPAPAVEALRETTPASAPAPAPARGATEAMADSTITPLIIDEGRVPPNAPLFAPTPPPEFLAPREPPPPPERRARAGRRASASTAASSTSSYSAFDDAASSVEAVAAAGAIYADLRARALLDAGRPRIEDFAAGAYAGLRSAALYDVSSEPSQGPRTGSGGLSDIACAAAPQREAALGALRLRMELLWEELRVPARDRDLFMSTVFLRAAKRRDGGVAARHAVAAHVRILVGHRARTLAVLDRIAARKAALDALRRAASEATDTPAADTLQRLVAAAAAETRSVVAAVAAWQAALWHPLPFVWRGAPYVAAMAEDARAAADAHPVLAALLASSAVDAGARDALLPWDYRGAGDAAAVTMRDERARVDALRGALTAQHARGAFTPMLRWHDTVTYLQ